MTGPEIRAAFTEADFPVAGLTNEQLERVAARALELYPDRHPTEAELGHLINDEQTRPEREAELARREAEWDETHSTASSPPTIHWRALIDFEAEVPDADRTKIRQIRERFNITHSIYLLQLFRIVETDYAKQYRPDVCERVISGRDRRRSVRVRGAEKAETA